MADATFLYLAFFMTIGSFILGFIASWNLKEVYDQWIYRADYAEVVMHPEMTDENGDLVNPSELLYLRITEDDDMIFDEDD